MRRRAPRSSEPPLPRARHARPGPLARPAAPRGPRSYIGADFLWDNLVTASQQNGPRAAVASAAVLAVCVQKDMLWGSLLGVAAFQLAAWWQRRQQ